MKSKPCINRDIVAIKHENMGSKFPQKNKVYKKGYAPHLCADWYGKLKNLKHLINKLKKKKPRRSRKNHLKKTNTSR